MSPLPWPLIGRRDPYAGVTPDPVRIESNVRIVPTPASRPPAHTGGNAEDCPACDGRTDLAYPFLCPDEGCSEHAVMYRVHAWLRAEEDDVLTALADLTDRYGPWTAAVLKFSDPKENPHV